MVKWKYVPKDNRTRNAIILLTLIAVILIVLTINPSSGSDFIIVLDAVQQTVITIAICFIALLWAYLIYDNYRKSSRPPKKPYRV